MTEVFSAGWPNAYPTTNTSLSVQLDPAKTEQLSFVFDYLYLNKYDSIYITHGITLFNKFCYESAVVLYNGSKLGETFTGVSTGDDEGIACVDYVFNQPQKKDNTTMNKYHFTVFGKFLCPCALAYSDKKVVVTFGERLSINRLKIPIAAIR